MTDNRVACEASVLSTDRTLACMQTHARAHKGNKDVHTTGKVTKKRGTNDTALRIASHFVYTQSSSVSLCVRTPCSFHRTT